jgi:PAS domain S-box-containing protein
MSEPSNHSSSIEEALRQSEERYQLVALTISDAIWDWNLLTNTVQWSHGLRSLFGYQNHDDKLHTWWAEHVHPDDLAHIEESVNAAIVAHESYWSGEYRFCRSDGSYAHVLDRGHLVYDEHGRAVRFVGAMEDISERVRQQQALIEQEREYQKTLEQRVAERTHELTAILQSSRKIALTLELNVVLELILEQLHTVAPYDGASIMSLEEGEWLEGRAYRGPKPSGWIRQFRFSIDNPVDRKVIASRQPLIAEDLHGDNPIGRYFQADHGERFAAIYAGVRSWMRIPLIVRDEIVGMLTLHHREPGHFTERDAEIALAFADQAAVAIHNARLYAQAQQLASLQERQRLARELHDSVSQALYSISLGAHTARSLLDIDPVRAGAALDYVLQLAEAGMAEMRALIFELRPESLEQEGLVAALEKQVSALRARHQLAVATELCAEPDIPLKAKEALFRIAQEALHNVVKHANASTVTVRLQPEGNLLALSVTDDGRGFDPTVDFPGHLGLQSMRERVEMLGGHVAVESSSGAGARILVQLPVD